MLSTLNSNNAPVQIKSKPTFFSINIPPLLLSLKAHSRYMQFLFSQPQTHSPFFTWPLVGFPSPDSQHFIFTCLSHPFIMFWRRQYWCLNFPGWCLNNLTSQTGAWLETQAFTSQWIFRAGVLKYTRDTCIISSLPPPISVSVV